MTLFPGVAFNLRRFHPLVTGMARAAWADFVRRVRANQPLLGQATDLHVFLFGTERSDLSDFRDLLRELQKGVCFYCPDVPFLERWSRRNADHGRDLAEGFERIHAPHDVGVSRQITAWAYEQLERNRGMVWAGGKSYVALGEGWRRAFAS